MNWNPELAEVDGSIASWDPRGNRCSGPNQPQQAGDSSKLLMSWNPELARVDGSIVA